MNALGYLRVMFAVDDLDDTLARLRKHGAQLVDEVVQYEHTYRLCYVRGPEGILIGLAEQIARTETFATGVDLPDSPGGWRRCPSGGQYRGMPCP